MDHARWLAIICMALVVGGCARTRQSAAENATQANAPTSAPVSAEQRQSELEQHVDRLTALGKQLPGPNAEQHRVLMIEALAELQATLPLIRPGGASDGAFDQQLDILAQARQRLGSAAPQVSPEPTLNAALAAADRALSRIAAERHDANAEITAALESAGRHIDELDTVHGALHRLVVAQTVRDMSHAIELMAGRTQ